MKSKILWIEDEAFSGLGKYRAPLETHSDFDVIFALNASDAEKIIYESEFDAVIVDIIIDPGTAQKWIDIFYDMSLGEKRKFLGRHLLYSLFKSDSEEAIVKLPPKPLWVKPEKFGILSVLRNDYIEKIRMDLNLKICENKGLHTPKTVAVDMVKIILNIK